MKIQWFYYLKYIIRNLEENKFFKTNWYIINVKATLLKTISWQNKMFQEDFPMLIKPSKTFGGAITHSSCSQLYSRLYTPLHEYNTSLSSTSNMKKKIHFQNKSSNHKYNTKKKKIGIRWNLFFLLSRIDAFFVTFF